jgi:hypothetical protein
MEENERERDDTEEMNGTGSSGMKRGRKKKRKEKKKREKRKEK